MDLTTVEYEKRGHIAYVTLNRPEKLNAMNAAMHRELADVWADFQRDPEMRAAILSGNGRYFSAGADLSGGAPEAEYRYDGNYPDITRANGVYKPIVSALHSHVVGYGMWIALDAERAREVGMINKIVPREDLMAEAEKAAQRLASLSPMAVQGTKELMVRGSNLDYTAVNQPTEFVQNRVMNSEDRKEGGRAFVEKREADWK